MKKTTCRRCLVCGELAAHARLVTRAYEREGVRFRVHDILVQRCNACREEIQTVQETDRVRMILDRRAARAA